MIYDTDILAGATAPGENGDQEQHPHCGNVAAVILAGAHRWERHRLDEVFWPPLLPIMFQPLLWHILAWLRRGGVSLAQVCANSHTQRLRRLLGVRGPDGIDLDYYEDVMPRGPAGCARDAATTMDAQTFIVLDAAILPCASLTDLLEAHRQSEAVMTVASCTRSRDQNGNGGHSEPVGIYVVERTALAAVPETGYQDIKESLIPSLYKQGRHITQYVLEPESVTRVHGWASYLSANMVALQATMSRGSALPGYGRVDGAFVHESARVDASARLVGGVLVGPGAVIQDGVIVSGPAIVGPKCLLRSGAIVSCTVMWDECEVGRDAIVDHGVLATSARVPHGEVFRNTVCLPTQAIGAAALQLSSDEPFHSLKDGWIPAMEGRSRSDSGPIESVPQAEDDAELCVTVGDA